MDGNPIAVYASYALYYVGGVGGGHKFTGDVELAASVEEIPLEARLPLRNAVDEARKILSLKTGPFTGRAEIYAHETMRGVRGTRLRGTNWAATAT